MMRVISQNNLRFQYDMMIIPSLIICVACFLIYISGEYSGDPNYGPLMSALNVLYFERPGYADHPGTPIHILGAFFLGLSWLVRLPFSSWRSPAFDILSHPETYLVIFNICIVALIAAANCFLGHQLLIATKKRFIAYIGQASVFMVFPYMLAFPLVTPDSLLIAATTTYISMIVPIVFAFDRSVFGARYFVTLGVVFGLCVATKITCSPLGFLLLLVGSKRNFFLVIVGSIFSFLLSTSPVISLYPDVIEYYFRILTHRGAAGTGEVGFPSIAFLIDNLMGMIPVAGGLFICMVVCFVMICFRSRLKGEARRFYSFFVCAFLSAGSLLFLVIMQAQERSRYIGPAFAITLLVYPVTYFLMERAFPKWRQWRFVCTAIALFVFVCVEYSVFQAADSYFSLISSVSRHNAGRIEILEQAKADGCAIITYYDAPIREYRLFFGNRTSRFKHAAALKAIYPDAVSYDVGTRTFETFSGDMKPDDVMSYLRRQKCVYLFGSTLERFDDFMIPRDLLTVISQIKNPHRTSSAILQLKLRPETTYEILTPPRR